MSTISNLYTELNSLLNTIYSGSHKKFDNPYVIEDNPDKTLNRGFGFYVGGSSNTNRSLSCHLSLERDIVITLSIVNRGTERDISIRETAEKTLLEDQFLLIQNIERSPSLNETVAKISYRSDNGVERVYGEANTFLMIQTTFSVEYLEIL